MEASPDLLCVRQLTSTAGLEAALADLEPDVLIMDYHIPGENSLRAMRNASEQDPGLVCMILSGYSHPEMLEAARIAGASMCLSKDVETRALLQSIRTCYLDRLLLGQNDASAVGG